MLSNTIVLILVTALAVLALAGVLVWVTYKTRPPVTPTVDLLSVKPTD
ncbi:ABC-type Fe3+ transport system permease subunit [Mycobacterium sp. OAS707]|jgi:ABC-type Fe3+ transport system permease subunit|nr:ABC-type Fe3+ transport system permease subunit [Mycobacterium sp. OAS707]